jgi:hypothetical protein
MAKKSSSGGGKSGKPASTARSAKSGRFVTEKAAKRRPSTTVVEGKPGGSKPGTKGKR